MPQWSIAEIEALQHHWDYQPSHPPSLDTLLRMRAQATRRIAFPPSRTLKPVTPRARWTCVFLYLPDGQATPAHGYMIERLRARDAGLLIVCATPAPDEIPSMVADITDALIWKGLEGFDFSAYALAADAVAQYSPGADMFVVNDSVLGPFGDIDPILDSMSWDLCGMTAWEQSGNHIQSYAFHLRGVDPGRVAALAPALSTRFAFARYRDVIYAQEVRLARVAAKTMSVGALWYGPSSMSDPSVHAALALIQHGFPFLKRKLLGRDAGIFPREALLAVLEENHHPRP